MIVPRHMVDLGQPGADVLETPYLLFSCDAWGTAYDQIEAIRTKLGDTADLIWGRCSGTRLTATEKHFTRGSTAIRCRSDTTSPVIRRDR